MSLLNREEILEHIEMGNIVIDPFDTKQLQGNHYEVRLGFYHYCKQQEENIVRCYNPFDPKHVRQYWGDSKLAIPFKEWEGKNGYSLVNISEKDNLIVIPPKGIILCHTLEFIGGRYCICTRMQTRSSLHKNGVTTCKCSGMGDPGYINRWILEVQNHLKEQPMVLPVGMRIAQIYFTKITPMKWSYDGKYQSSNDPEELKKNWTPDQMLPRLDRDWDAGRLHEFYDIPEGGK